MVGDGTVNRRGRHADAAAQGVQAQLVVHEGKPGTRVVVQDAGRITMVHPEDTEFLQAAGAEEPVHGGSLKGAAVRRTAARNSPNAGRTFPSRCWTHPATAGS